MTRVQLEMNIGEIILVMSDGIPGAIIVMANCIAKSDSIDPQNMLGGLGIILDLDTLKIYGSDIWILYSRYCWEDLTKFMAVLRAWQLGFLTDQQVRDGDFNSEEMLVQVQARLVDFGRQTASRT